MLDFVVLIPPPALEDTTAREVSVKINDGKEMFLSLASNSAETTLLHGNTGDTVNGMLVDTNDHGDRSSVIEFDFVLEPTASKLASSKGLPFFFRAVEQPAADVNAGFEPPEEGPLEPAHGDTPHRETVVPFDPPIIVDEAHDIRSPADLLGG